MYMGKTKKTYMSNNFSKNNTRKLFKNGSKKEHAVIT